MEILGVFQSPSEKLDLAMIFITHNPALLAEFAILRKPGRLDTAEYELMKKHSEYSWAVLRMLSGFERAALDILHHHESFDGRGYPAGLKKNGIPIASRIVCVIDAFDAMVSSRPYRQGLPYEEAVPSQGSKRYAI
jgi:HD-GYP domain-containing protein (c-di-GMP phosphodiesterase class II)